VDRSAARLFSDRDFSHLIADIVSIPVLDLDDQDAVGFAIEATTRVSSEVSAMLVARPSAASAIFGAIVAGRTATAVINIAEPPQDAVL